MFSFGSKRWPGLAKLAEECGELLQVIGKLMQVKGRSKHWSGNMREKMVEELADVKAATRFVELHCLTPIERGLVTRRMEMKLAKFEKWHQEESK